MLQVYKLTEEKSLVDETTRPLEVKNPDTMTDREIAAVCEQKCRVLILDLNA
jgi:hypothetical protein